MIPPLLLFATTLPPDLPPEMEEAPRPDAPSPTEEPPPAEEEPEWAGPPQMEERGEDREALLAHLEGLFTLAQVVTMNAEGAVRLVEGTYHRAFDRLAYEPLPDNPRMWLYGLLMQVHDEQSRAGAAAPSEAPPDLPSQPAAAGADAFRRRMAEQFVHQALPAAFATLPPDQRLLLMLCHVQQLSRDEAGRILGLPAEEAARRLEAARQALNAALYDNATEVERHLLATSLPGEWDRAALEHLARTELTPPPATLRPSMRDHAGMAGGPPEPIPVPAPLPAAAPAKPGGTVRLGHLLTRLTAALLIIMVAGLLGYLFSGVLREQPELNLLTLSIQQVDDVEVAVRTPSPEQAERYVLDSLGWRIVLPGIEQARLVGLDVHEIAEGVTVPVFVYEDAATGQAVTLYALNYEMLLRHASRIRLERDILQQIQGDGNFELHDLGEERALIWRNRDDIFIAVTDPAVADLRERIVFPS
jgi:DNA-directed RNA polymerase specialized sigma24 family protein